ncbi:MAG: hypothetical protein ACPLZD_04380 [Candidatus Saccharicenans sp.]
MKKNKIKYLFFSVLFLVVFHFSAWSQEVEVLRGVLLILPENSQVKLNWVLPPMDPALREEYRDKINFSVDGDGVPLIALGNRILINPVKQYSGRLTVPFQDFFHLNSGLLLFSTESDFGFISPVKELNYDDETGLPLFPFQPIASMPEAGEGADYTVNGRIFRGDNCVYFLINRSWLDNSPRYIQQVIYCLKSEKISTSPDDSRATLIFEPVLVTEKINLEEPGWGLIQAISGDGLTTFLARDNKIYRLAQGNNQPELWYEHPEQKNIEDLQFSSSAGLIYTTQNSVGLAEKDKALEFLQVQSSPKIFLKENNLYVLFSDSGGLVRLDNIADLKRFNASERKVTAVDGVKYRGGSGTPAIAFLFLAVYLLFFIFWLVALVDILKSDFSNRFKILWLLFLLLAFLSLILIFIFGLFFGRSSLVPALLFVIFIIEISYFLFAHQSKKGIKEGK